MSYKTELIIADIVKDIDKNKYVMPAIQREFVWNSERIETLFDSLMQGYPIGGFLFWEISKEKLQDYNFYKFLTNYHELNSRHNEKANLNGSEGVISVLDGQQRLTALYIGLKGSYATKIPGKHKTNINAYPVKKLYLNIVTKRKKDNKNDEIDNESNDTNLNKYNFKFLEPNKIENNEDEYWFEVGQILNMECGEYAVFVTDNISFNEKIQYNQEQAKYAMLTLAKLWDIIHKVGYITHYNEKSEDLDKVLNIFIRVNNGGLELTYSDLLLSIASAQWGKEFNAREEITSFVDEINAIGFAVNKDFILKSSLVLSDSSDIAFKINNFTIDKTSKIRDDWDTIKKAIKQAVVLVNSFGYTKDNFKTNNALIPIAYYLKKIGLPDNFIETDKQIENRKQIKQWLIRSLLKKTFSGQPDNVIKPIRDIIKTNETNDFPYDKIVERFKGTNKTIIFAEDDIDAFLAKLEYGKPETTNVLMLLYESFDYRDIFHIDHIYPKSKFTKRFLQNKGIAEESIKDYTDSVNNICNLQILRATPNIEKSDKDFDIWFNEHNTTERSQKEYREKHYLPEMEYSYSNFLQFIEKRREILKSKLMEILNVK